MASRCTTSSARASGSRVVKVPERALTADVDAMLAAVSPATRMVCLANPNKPDRQHAAPRRGGAPARRPAAGGAADHRFRLCRVCRRSDYDAGASLVDAGNNTVMTRTFSKIYGPGRPPARLVLRAARGGGRAEPAARAVQRQRHCPGSRDRRPGRAELGRGRPRPQHRPARPADGPRCRRSASASGRARAISCWPTSPRRSVPPRPTPALRQRGLIVRAMRSYGLPQTLRITIGTTEECDLVIEALAAFMGTSPPHG